MANYADPATISMAQPGRLQPGPLLTMTAGVLAVLISAFFYFQTTSAAAEALTLKDQIKQGQAQLDQRKTVTSKLAQYDTWAKSLHTIYDQQKNWDTTFSAIEDRLYKHMRITAMTISHDGTFQFTGVVPSYVDYANLYNSLLARYPKDKDPYFTNLKPDAVNKQADGIGVGFHATVVPDPLLPPNPL